MSKEHQTWVKERYATRLKEGKETYKEIKNFLKDWSMKSEKSSNSGETSEKTSEKVTPIVTSGNWISEYKRYLSEEESLQNAQKVVNHFNGTDWSPEAICALCGNMRHESTMNPDMYEHGYSWEADRGYGLVQWTPRSKYWKWAEDNGLDPRSGDSQLARIDYEVNKNIQWIPKKSYGKMTFAQFRTNSGGWSVDYLTEAFTWCYERPATGPGQKSMPKRKAFAQKCFNQFFSGSGGSAKSTYTAKEGIAYGLRNGGLKATESSTATLSEMTVESEATEINHSVPIGKINGMRFSAPKYVRGIYVHERKQSNEFRAREGYMPLPAHEFIHLNGPQENYYAPEALKLFSILRDRLGYKQLIVVRGYEPDTENSSSHSLGIAMDIYVETPEEAIKIADTAWGMGIRAIAIGPKFVHVDAGPEATWGYDNLAVYHGPGTVKASGLQYGY